MNKSVTNRNFRRFIKRLIKPLSPRFIMALLTTLVASLFGGKSAYSTPSDVTVNWGGLAHPTSPGLYTSDITTSGGNSVTVTNNTTENSSNGISNANISTQSGSLSLNNYSGNVSVSSGISTVSGDLDLVNTATGGTITSNVNLGTNSGSSVTLSGGSLVGDITIGNSSQTVTFEGGSLTGNINGAGNGHVIIDPSEAALNTTTLNGNINVDLVTINSNKTLSNYVNDNSIIADVDLNSGSTLILGTGTLTGTIDGVGGANGKVRLNDSTTIGSNTVIGGVDGISTLEIASSKTINLNTDVKATNTNILSSATLNLGTGNSIDGSVTVSSNANLTLNNSSSVSGNINGSGTMSVSSNSDAQVDGNIGNTTALTSVTLNSGSTLDLSYGDGSLNATNT